jgi:hypothetical protein
MLKLILFHTLCRRDFSQLKKRFDLCDYCQVHHIIPRQFQNHPIVQHMNIDDGHNLMLLPNKIGKKVLNTKRPIHDGGHMRYNEHVNNLLDYLSEDEDIMDLIQRLRQRIRGSDPWVLK